MRLPKGLFLMSGRCGRMRSVSSECSVPFVTESVDCTT